MAAAQIDNTGEYILPDGEVPGNVMIIVLSNLPVKSLLKFRSVCKTWNSVISSPYFMKIHHARQSVIAKSLLVSWESDILFKSEFALLSHKYEISEILTPVEERLDTVFVSCKGLVCLSILKRGIRDKNILWNPATRKYRYLQVPDPKVKYGREFQILGLGYLEATDDYMIVGLNFSPAFQQSLSIYTLTSDTWKELDCECQDIPSCPVAPTFMNKRIHWLESFAWPMTRRVIAFDVEKEIKSSFAVPHPDLDPDILSGQTLSIKGCLSVVFMPRYNGGGIVVWVMEKYGDEGSWVKQYNIGFTKENIPLGSWKETEIIFTYKKDGADCLVLYEPGGTRDMVFFDRPSFSSRRCRVLNYVESLAPV